MSDDNDFEDLLEGLDPPSKPAPTTVAASKETIQPVINPPVVKSKTSPATAKPKKTTTKATPDKDIDWGDDNLNDLFPGDAKPKSVATPDRSNQTVDIGDILGLGIDSSAPPKRPPTGERRVDQSKSSNRPTLTVTQEDDTDSVRAGGGYQPSQGGSSRAGGGLRKKALGGGGGSVTFGEASLFESETGASERKALTFTENPRTKKERDSLADLLSDPVGSVHSGKDINDWLSGEPEKKLQPDDWMNIAKKKDSSSSVVGGERPKSAESKKDKQRDIGQPSKAPGGNFLSSNGSSFLGEEIPLEQILGSGKSSIPVEPAFPQHQERLPVTPARSSEQHHETPISRPMTASLSLPTSGTSHHSNRPVTAPSRHRDDDVMSVASGNASVRSMDILSGGGASHANVLDEITNSSQSTRSRSAPRRSAPASQLYDPLQSSLAPAAPIAYTGQTHAVSSHNEQNLWIEEKEYLIQKYENKIKHLIEWQQEQSKRSSDEKDAMSVHYKSLLDLVEKDRVELIARHDRNLKDMEVRHQQSIQQLRELNDRSFDDAKNEFEKKLEHIKQQKATEIEAINSAASHFKSVNVVVEQLETQARTIGELSHNLGNKQSSTLDAREFQIRVKENELKVLEERLGRQLEDTETERRKMQELITKMESHMRENIQSIESDKYAMIQDQARLAAEKKNLQMHQQEQNEKIATERAWLEKAKSDFEKEQREQRSLLYEERRTLGIDRAKLDASLKSYSDRERHESVKGAQAEAEISGSLKAIAQEHQELAKTAAKLTIERDQLEHDKMAVEKNKKRFEIERRTLDGSLIENKHRQHQLEQLAADAKKIREEGLESLSKATAIELEDNQRLQAIKNQLTSLRSQEQSLAQERLLLAQQQKSLEAQKETILCSKCSGSAYNAAFSMSMPGLQKSSEFAPMEVFNARDLARTSLDSGFNTPADFTAAPGQQMSQAAFADMMRQALEVDNQIHELRLSAESDKEFLQGESVWLNSLRESQDW